MLCSALAFSYCFPWHFSAKKSQLQHLLLGDAVVADIRPDQDMGLIIQFVNKYAQAAKVSHRALSFNGVFVRLFMRMRFLAENVCTRL